MSRNAYLHYTEYYVKLKFPFFLSRRLVVPYCCRTVLIKHIYLCYDIYLCVVLIQLVHMYHFCVIFTSMLHGVGVLFTPMNVQYVSTRAHSKNGAHNRHTAAVAAVHSSLLIYILRVCLCVCVHMCVTLSVQWFRACALDKFWYYTYTTLHYARCMNAK